eukprot:491066_1
MTSNDEMIVGTVSLDFSHDTSIDVDIEAIAELCSEEKRGKPTRFIMVFIALHLICIMQCSSALWNHPLPLQDTEQHQHVIMIHVSVISYLIGFIISLFCFPTLMILVTANTNITRAIPWTLVIFMVLDYFMFLLMFVLSFIGLYQSLATIHNQAEPRSTFSSLPFIWKSSFLSSWAISTIIVIMTSISSYQNHALCSFFSNTL